MISKEMIGLGIQKAVAFLYRSELMLNKVYDNNDFDVITNNETLAMELELSNKTTLTLAMPPSVANMENQTANCSARLPSLSNKVILLET